MPQNPRRLRTVPTVVVAVMAICCLRSGVRSKKDDYNNLHKHIDSLIELLPMTICNSVYDDRNKYISGFAAELDGGASREGGLSLKEAVDQLVIYKEVVKTKCEPSRYYSMDGKCNNLNHPDWGAAFEPFIRELPNHYEDGKLIPRLYAKGSQNPKQPLPSARDVSTHCLPSLNHEGGSDLHVQHNQNMMQFGQFFSHDLALTPVMEGFSCCTSLDENGFHPDTFTGGACFPIKIADDDRRFEHCMGFNRSVYRLDPSGVAQQLSSATHFIDQSTVYGSTTDFANSVRTFVNGTLRTDVFGLLPQDNSQKCMLRTPLSGCPVAGDNRLNVFPGLTATHLVFHLEHNRLAAILQTLHPAWSDTQLFQQARALLIAQTQNIIYKEYLPLILGPKVIKFFGLNESASYNSSINPSIINSFQTAAFRFGHSEINNRLMLMAHNDSSEEEIKYLFFRPHKLFHQGRPIVADLFLSQMIHRSQKVDASFAEGVTDWLFLGVDSPNTSNDLPARSIQRGRDHGLAPFLDFLKHALNEFGDQARDLLGSRLVFPSCCAGLHMSVEDIDLFVGGVSEEPVEGGVVGPTFAYLIGKQFKHLREGDRLFFDTEGSDAEFTPEQVDSIKQTSYSGIICRNIGLEKVPLHPFKVPDNDTNPYVNCSSIPDLDFSLW